MKMKHLLASGTAVLMLGLVAVGCNENPDGPNNPGTAPTAPTNATAVSLSATSVSVKWTASTDTGTITYKVTRAATGSASDTATIENLSGTSATFNGLTASEYTFTIVAVRSGSASTSISVKWAPAARFNSTTLKLYEKKSASPSGFSIDAETGGPQPVSLAVSKPGKAQLAIFVLDSTSNNTNTLLIGPAYAFPEYAASGNFNPAKVDSSTYISPTDFVVSSLDTWYSASPIDAVITSSSTTNTAAYTLTGNNLNASRGFFVRTGLAGNYHYARVFVKATGGKIVQGTYPDRYIEVEVSYQNTPNLPYAKAGVPAAAGVRAMRLPGR